MSAKKQKNQPNNNRSNQPAPLSGSHKVKQKNHSGQKNNPNHGL